MSQSQVDRYIITLKKDSSPDDFEVVAEELRSQGGKITQLIDREEVKILTVEFPANLNMTKLTSGHASVEIIERELD